ncbi:MAG: hypothetical protein WA960_17865 [Tunicatimonas sp.]
MMKAQANISSIEVVNDLTYYWNDTDFINLLKIMDFPDAETSKPEELKDLVLMAITDFEPDEAARVLLTYKLDKKLTEGQIHSLSHEMIEDKIAEEYPDPALHYDLFNINQLLFKAYNGTFPNTEATIIKLEIHTDQETEINSEVLLKIIGASLSDRSLILRLYADQISGKSPFDDAAKIIWLFNKEGDNGYEIVTSRYWIDKEDIEQIAYKANILFYEDAE